MAIEFITPDLIRVNGYFVEINDSREPDVFDDLAAQYNAALAESEPARPLHDIEFDLRSVSAIVPNFDVEWMAYQQIPRFLDLAQRAADERAISYRGFKVGASACAVSVGLRRDWVLIRRQLNTLSGRPKTLCRDGSAGQGHGQGVR